MITKDLKTIETHEAMAGSRYTLAAILMKRTTELIRGARPKPGLAKEFCPRRQGEIPNQSFPKIALEEFRTGKLTWAHPSKPVSKDLVDPDAIIFGE